MRFSKYSNQQPQYLPDFLTNYIFMEQTAGELEKLEVFMALRRKIWLKNWLVKIQVARENVCLCVCVGHTVCACVC